MVDRGISETGKAYGPKYSQVFLHDPNNFNPSSRNLSTRE